MKIIYYMLYTNEKGFIAHTSDKVALVICRHGCFAKRGSNYFLWLNLKHIKSATYIYNCPAILTSLSVYSEVY